MIEEKREVGTHMNKIGSESNRMRNSIKSGLCLLLGAALLFGCVPTPTEEAVTNKAEGRLENLILETRPIDGYAIAPESKEPQSDSAQLTEPEHAEKTDENRSNTLRFSLGAPDRVTDSFSGKVYGGTLNVKIDAETEIPNVAAVPVFTVRVKTFTPEERERMTKALLGDGPYYNFNRDLAIKVSEEQNIEQQTKELTDLDNRIYGENYNYEQARWVAEQNLNSYLKSYAELPEPGPMEPWTGSFSGERTVVANAENRYLSFSEGAMCLYDETMNAAHTFGGHTPETAEQREAMDAAREAFFALTGEQFEASTITYDDDLFLKYQGLSIQDFPPEEYSVSLIRKVAGIPCYPYSAYHGSDTAMQAAGVSFDYDDPVIPENAEALIRDGKLVALNWYNIVENVRTENENVELLPFDKILELFKKQIFRSIYLDEGEGTEWSYTMVVERICLSYMKVKKKDAPNERYLLPVWDFMGYDYNDEIDNSSQIGHKAWFSAQSLLTINAIDGSIIDRDAGY